MVSGRPALTIDPATLRVMAVDIPKGSTRGCGCDHFPLPILAECTEPLTTRLPIFVAFGHGAETGAFRCRVVVGHGRC